MDRPDIRWDAETGRVAIATGMDAPRQWFVYKPGSGGGYSTGEREGVSDWPPFS